MVYLKCPRFFLSVLAPIGNTSTNCSSPAINMQNEDSAPAIDQTSPSGLPPGDGKLSNSIFLRSGSLVEGALNSLLDACDAVRRFVLSPDPRIATPQEVCNTPQSLARSGFAATNAVPSCPTLNPRLFTMISLQTLAHEPWVRRRPPFAAKTTLSLRRPTTRRRLTGCPKEEGIAPTARHLLSPCAPGCWWHRSYSRFYS